VKEEGRRKKEEGRRKKVNFRFGVVLGAGSPKSMLEAKILNNPPLILILLHNFVDSRVRQYISVSLVQ
jgi:hypothetical protein